MSKICKIVAAGAGLWAVLRLFYGWKWGRSARAASIICHTCTRHSFTCCTHSKHGSEPADKRARRFLETQDLGRENSRPARRAYVALPGADFTPCYCRLLGCMQPNYLWFACKILNFFINGRIVCLGELFYELIYFIISIAHWLANFNNLGFLWIAKNRP